MERPCAHCDLCGHCMCSYFASRFPNLLMTAYAFGLQHCAKEPMFAKYYPPEAQETPLSLDIIAARLPEGSQLPAGSSSALQQALVRAPADLTDLAGFEIAGGGISLHASRSKDHCRS